jgi:hypothetical protein
MENAGYSFRARPTGRFFLTVFLIGRISATGFNQVAGKVSLYFIDIQIYHASIVVYKHDHVNDHVGACLSVHRPLIPHFSQAIYY